jgi:hypothetical protein
LLRHGMRSGRYSKPSNPANDNISAECGLLCAGFPCFTQYHHVHHKCHSSEICADYLDRLASRRTLAVSLHYVCLTCILHPQGLREHRGYSLKIWGLLVRTPLSQRNRALRLHETRQDPFPWGDCEPPWFEMKWGL